ncbi:MAG: hypothetical protein ACI92A_000580, partial [Candidatus Paceibacteria bacterium]
HRRAITSGKGGVKGLGIVADLADVVHSNSLLNTVIVLKRLCNKVQQG